MLITILGAYSCFNGSKCLHICQEDNNNNSLSICECISGFTLLDDEISCQRKCVSCFVVNNTIKALYFVVTECPPNSFGTNCSEECTCMNDGVCDLVDGTCTCHQGFTGSSCEMRMYVFIHVNNIVHININQQYVILHVLKKAEYAQLLITALVWKVS